MDTRVNLEGRPAGSIPLETIFGVVDWMMIELEASLVNDQESMAWNLEPTLDDLILITMPTDEVSGGCPWLGTFQLSEAQAVAVRERVGTQLSRLIKLFGWRWRQRGDLNPNMKAHLALGIDSLRWNTGERFELPDPQLQESIV